MGAYDHTQIIAGCFFVSLFFFPGRKGSIARARGATSTSTLKRYRNQSIIRNNGFLKTTFHRPPPGGHVVSPHICQSRTPCSTASWTSCTSELSKGCLHVASYDVLDENNSLGYGSVTLGVTEGRHREKRRESDYRYPSRERFSADKTLLNIGLKEPLKFLHRNARVRFYFKEMRLRQILCHKRRQDLY